MLKVELSLGIVFSLFRPVTYARLALFRINMLKIVQANRMKNGRFKNTQYGTLSLGLKMPIFFGQQCNNVLQAKFSI
jgi:hypothetical protein